jgi:transposase
MPEVRDGFPPGSQPLCQDAGRRPLTMNWNSVPVEGRDGHIKMIKRQMFGRASLPLLRKRVLLTARN